MLGTLPAAFSTSAATKRPWGPLPCKPSSFTPSCWASLRALGLAITRLPPTAATSAMGSTFTSGAGVGGGTAAGGAVAVGVAVGEGVAVPLARKFSNSASVSTTKPIVSPTGAVLPAGSSTAPRKPASNDSTSISALSDSTTSTDSPRSTRSPGCLSHSTIFPSVIVELRAGMKISKVAIRCFSTAFGGSYRRSSSTFAKRLHHPISHHD